jgi:hypothetical protein
LLNRQAKTASEEAVRSGGQVAGEQIEALERLARLVVICDAAQPPTRKRWPVVVALVFTLLIASVLLFARVAETEIELDMALSEVSFVLPTQQKLTELMALSAVGVSGLREMQLPRARDRGAQTLLASEGAGSGLRLSVASDGKRQGSISLETLMPPAETRVWVRHTELPREHRLSLQSSGLELLAAVNGPLQVRFSGGGVQQLDFVTPQAVLLQSGANEVDLDLTFLDSGKNVFSTQLSTSNLSFLRIDEAMVRHVSTILSGTLYFESLNSQERKFRPGEMIQFERALGEIRTLNLQEDHIDLKFHGRVRGLSVGSGDGQYSLMPTWLEWLKARHGLSLLWGTALYLFGMIVGALRWFGRNL